MELNVSYSSPNNLWTIKSGSIRREEHVSVIGKYRNTYRILVRKLEEKGPLGRTSSGWEERFRMGLTDTG
jgi:hypothetical protein